MKNNNITELINKELNEETKRIFNELMNLYNKKIRVNTIFTDLIKEKINKKYYFFCSEIEKRIIKLIPTGLNICPTGEWVFINDIELNNMHERKYKSKEEELINKFINDIYADIISLKYNNIFDIIERNRCKYLKDIYLYNYNYLFDIISNKLMDNKIKIISINPLKIKNED